MVVGAMRTPKWKAAREGGYQWFRRAFAIVTNAVLGAVPETLVASSPTAPPDAADPAQCFPFPGCIVVVPPGASVLVADPDHDPVIVSGTASPVAVKAILANAMVQAAIAAGGTAIMDPLVGTGGICITPAGINVIGTLLNNGAPLP